MIPERTGKEDFWSHIYRYRFAANYVKGKQVLDIACGEGYGSFGLLKCGARNVIGVDVCEPVCRHVRLKYGIDSTVGRAENIPLQDNSMDVVVSFETIEHIQFPERFLRECVRVLKKGGTAIISTPNVTPLSENSGHNPFHCSEMDHHFFISAIATWFSTCESFAQYPIHAKGYGITSLIALESPLARMKGMWRIRTLMQSMFCSNIKGEVEDKHRLEPGEFIKRRLNFLHTLVNPYIVRKSTVLDPENSRFVIAVAVK